MCVCVCVICDQSECVCIFVGVYSAYIYSGVLDDSNTPLDPN